MGAGAEASVRFLFHISNRFSVPLSPEVPRNR